jgi:hypothetical protein
MGSTMAAASAITAISTAIAIARVAQATSRRRTGAASRSGLLGRGR